MRSLLRVIELISEWSGKVISWACVVLVIVLCYEVTARYVFDAPTIWAHATGCMLGLTIAAMGLAYTHKHRAHVRVDFFYNRLSPRGRVIVDVICTLLFLVPLLGILVYASAVRMGTSWAIHETITISYWYPPAGPVRTVFFLGFCLFFLQGIAQLIRNLHLLIKNERV